MVRLEEEPNAMTYRLTWLQGWLAALGIRVAPTEASAQRIEELPLQRLRKILVVVAKLTGARVTEQLLVDRMNPECMMFITRADVGEGDCLELQLLVPGFGSIALKGTIAWLRASSKGRLEGELTLDATENQRAILADYLQRDAKGYR